MSIARYQPLRERKERSRSPPAQPADTSLDTATITIAPRIADGNLKADK